MDLTRKILQQVAEIATGQSIRLAVSPSLALRCVQFLHSTMSLIRGASGPRVRTSSLRSTGSELRCTSKTAAKALAVRLMPKVVANRPRSGHQNTIRLNSDEIIHSTHLIGISRHCRSLGSRVGQTSSVSMTLKSGFMQGAAVVSCCTQATRRPVMSERRQVGRGYQMWVECGSPTHFECTHILEHTQQRLPQDLISKIKHAAFAYVEGGERPPIFLIQKGPPRSWSDRKQGLRDHQMGKERWEMRAQQRSSPTCQNLCIS